MNKSALILTLGLLSSAELAFANARLGARVGAVRFDSSYSVNNVSVALSEEEATLALFGEIPVKNKSGLNLSVSYTSTTGDHSGPGRAPVKISKYSFSPEIKLRSSRDTSFSVYIAVGLGVHLRKGDDPEVVSNPSDQFNTDFSDVTAVTAGPVASGGFEWYDGDRIYGLLELRAESSEMTNYGIFMGMSTALGGSAN